MSNPSNILPFADDEKKSVIAEHPIPSLMEEAEQKYKKKLSSQSATLRSAVAEYRRRYRRAPPKGFDEWWSFAQKYNVKMVDEYDGLMEDLKPFWELSGEEIRRRAAQVGELPSIDLVRIRDGEATVINVNPNFKDTEVSARARGFRSMTGKFVHLLPDMDFPINAKAEGRVLVPWEHRMYPNLTEQDSSVGVLQMLGGTFKPDWGADGNVWEAWRRTCDPQSPARRLFSSLRTSSNLQVKNHLASSEVTPGSDFKFMKTTSSTEDYCSHPYAHYQQGHFFSDWRSIPVLYPVFSPAKAQGFMDIRIPSHYYYGSTKRYTYGWDSVNLELKAVDPMEVPWEDKIDKIFWRGATTGGGSHPPGFAPRYQRHRFLRMTSDKSNATRVVTFADPPSSESNWVAVAAPLAKLNEEIMDAAFVKAVSASGYPGGLVALEASHRFGDSVPLGRHWAYKYLVDLDGMSYSGRFMSFLASDSVPIKSTVYDEFFTDWIQPWVHFIPLSSSYLEIYNIHAYFSGATQSTLEAANSTQADTPLEQRGSVEGDKRLRRIARAGKRWKQTIGRTIDMEAYVYRLCLEWARLWADDRDSMNFSL
ncbi:capsular associated protein [Flammula alnicola]|nr:capsular associated protein [Flammula alnicola]